MQPAALQVHNSGRRRGGLRAAGLQRLVSALLRLRLDPDGMALSTELQVAFEGLKSSGQLETFCLTFERYFKVARGCSEGAAAAAAGPRRHGAPHRAAGSL